MKPNKNIDRLFQEKLKDMEVTPPEDVWNRIESQLNSERERRVVPLWFKIGVAAAIILLLAVGGINYFKNGSIQQNIENSITDIESNDSPSLLNDNDPNKIPYDNNQETIVASPNSSDKKELNNESGEVTSSIVEVNNSASDKENNDEDKINSTEDEVLIARTENIMQKTSLKDDMVKNKNLPKKESISQNNNLKDSEENMNSVVVSDSNQNKEENTKVSYENIENLEDTLDNKINEDFKIESEEITRWSVASVIAPVIYNSFNTNGSPLDLKFKNNPKEGSQSISYGVKFGYKFNKKLSIQSGLSVLNVGYTVGEVYINPSPQFAARLHNVNYVSTATILNVDATNIQGQTEIETEITEPVRGSLNQDYGYYEVPLELRYNMVNGNKFGFHLVGGFSTLFLNSNDVYVETSVFSSDLGEASNLNSVNFSGNLGIDLDYLINKSLYVNASPMLKVYTNTFSQGTNNFKPYAIGFYMGLNYRF